MREQMQTLRKKYNDQMKAVLNEEQYAKYEVGQARGSGQMRGGERSGEKPGGKAGRKPVIPNKPKTKPVGLPQAFGFGLGEVYLVWVLVVLMLYHLCRWYAAYKAKHKHNWILSYL